MLPSPVTAVLLDLDGTIIDSAPGIVATVADTLSELGLPAVAPTRLQSVAGPPLPWGLQHVAGVPATQLERAVTLYRHRYAAGAMLAAPVFDGMRDLVVSLHGAGLPIALATSKPEHYARQILDHVQLTGYFTAVCGALDDGPSSTKAVVVDRALTTLRETGTDTSGAVLLGDRVHDVEGAAVHGVPCIVAGWGYGAGDDLSHAAATVAHAAHVRELLEVNTLPVDR